MKQILKKLLVSTDGSAYSQVCCNYAVWIAERVGFSIDFLYLTDLRQFEMPIAADLSGSLGVHTPPQIIMENIQKEERCKASSIEKKTREFFYKKGFRNVIQFYHRNGLLSDCLKDFEKEAELVLLGKRGENANYATTDLGSNMERVVRVSTKPILTTPRKFIPITKIVLAFDGGKSCLNAIRFLCENVAFSDQELHVITISENEDDKSAFENMDQAKSIVADRKGGNVFKILYGNTEDQIARYVDSKEINLLVLGIRNHNLLHNVFFGNTTTILIRACRIPVLCFP